MLEYSDLALPPELITRFEGWCEMQWQAYESAVRPGLAEPAHYPTPEPVNQQRFFGIGRELAIELKRFLGPDVTVYYWSDESESRAEAVELAG